MGTLPAITADSLGNRTAVALGLPPLRKDPGDSSTRQNLLRWVAVQDRDPPGQWTDDAWQQANSFHSAVYIAVNTIMTAMSGATVVVSRRTKPTLRKSTAASATGSGESDWEPVEAEHEIARLFARPNTKDTTADFISEYVLCRSLFGQATVMWNPGRDGKPADLWNLRKNYLTSLPGLSPTFPSGAYLYTMTQPMLWSDTSGAITIPRERVVLHRRPHPRFPWDGYSPLTAGNKYVDHLNAVVDSRQMAMDRGLSLDAIISIAGSNDDERQQVDGRFRERFTGSNRGQRYAVVDGERVAVNMLGTTPDKMSYTDGYDQGTGAVLALFGVPAEVAFLAGAGSYSQFYAAVRAFQDGTMKPEAKGIGDRLTKDLIQPHWGDDYRVEIKLPPIMDPEQRERQIGTLMTGNAVTVNEIRAAYDMPPMEGGDVTPKEFEAKIQQANQPEQPEQPEDPIAALLGGGNPNAEPAAPGDVDGPDVGTAAEGSLPGAVAKSVNLEDITRAALQFAKAMGRKNPCWPGYEMVGTKIKNGRRVPNCVPIKRKKSLTGCGDCSGDCQPPRFVKAEYQGRTVTLNKPFRTKGGAKKFAVYVKNDAGNVVIVRFGDPDMEIKRDDPEARKNFRARHNCADAKDKTKAAYWSCRMWSSTPVSEAAN